MSFSISGLTAVLIATACAADAAQPALIASGACRDGLPSGAYELRMADGRLRVMGAFHNGKRTGTFIFWNASGGRLAAIPYDEDLRNGTVALWHLKGRPAREDGRRLEAPVVAGRPHGARRSWYPSGRLRGEFSYEQGALREAKAWDGAGRLQDDTAARRTAQQDARTEETYIVTLERMVDEHRPPCD